VADGLRISATSCRPDALTPPCSGSGSWSVATPAIRVRSAACKWSVNTGDKLQSFIMLRLCQLHPLVLRRRLQTTSGSAYSAVAVGALEGGGHSGNHDALH
jgi:hypothetical protein